MGIQHATGSTGPSAGVAEADNTSHDAVIVSGVVQYKVCQVPEATCETERGHSRCEYGWRGYVSSATILGTDQLHVSLTRARGVPSVSGQHGVQTSPDPMETHGG